MRFVDILLSDKVLSCVKCSAQQWNFKQKSSFKNWNSGENLDTVVNTYKDVDLIWFSINIALLWLHRLIFLTPGHIVAFFHVLTSCSFDLVKGPDVCVY